MVIKNTSWVSVGNKKQGDWICKYLIRHYGVNHEQLNYKTVGKLVCDGESVDGLVLTESQLARMGSAWSSYKSRNRKGKRVPLTVSKEGRFLIQQEAQRFNKSEQRYMDDILQRQFKLIRNRIGTRSYFSKREKLKESVGELLELCRSGSCEQLDLLERVQEKAELVDNLLKKFDDGVYWQDIEPENSRPKGSE